MELVDVVDSKSTAGDSVPVRVRSPAPYQYNPNLFPIGDGFGLFVFFDRYETTYFRNGVKRKPTSKPRGPRKKERPYRYTEVKKFPSTLFFIQGKFDKAGDMQYTINALNTRFRGRRLLSTVQSRFLPEIHDGTAGHESKPAARLPQGQ